MAPHTCSPHLPSARSILRGTALGLLLLVHMPGEAGTLTTGRDTIILTKPVAIRVTQTDGDGISYSLDLRVEHESGRFRVTTNQRGDTPEEAIETQKHDTRWQGRYLLIGYDRGGGNASRLALVTVFSLRNGKFVHLGEADPELSKGGTFRDRYNKFELNDLTSSAGAPTFPIVLEKKNDRFRVNLDKTWAEQRKAYQQTAGTIREILTKASRRPQDLTIDLPEALLFNAVLTKYCGQSRELANTVSIADTALAGKELKSFREIIARVVPGELPAPAVRVVRAKP